MMDTITRPRSRLTRAAYWIATIVIAFADGAGGVADIMRVQPIAEIMTHLGYPLYFCVILGVWKLLGAVAVLIPGTPRLKEWAYAGMMFDLTGAVASHSALRDDATKLIPPIVLIVVTVVSWSLRPPTRRLAGPDL